jgi:hypothetical protein
MNPPRRVVRRLGGGGGVEEPDEGFVIIEGFLQGLAILGKGGVENGEGSQLREQLLLHILSLDAQPTAFAARSELGINTLGLDYKM